MTQAQAQAAVSAIVGAGFQCRALKDGAGVWTVIGFANNGATIPLASAEALATSLGALVTTTEVSYV